MTLICSQGENPGLEGTTSLHDRAGWKLFMNDEDLGGVGLSGERGHRRGLTLVQKEADVTPPLVKAQAGGFLPGNLLPPILQALPCAWLWPQRSYRSWGKGIQPKTWLKSI